MEQCINISQTGMDNIIKIYKFLKELKENQWDFSSYVEEFDENDCGTTCCLMGWFPKIFPEKFKWQKFTFIDISEEFQRLEVLLIEDNSLLDYYSLDKIENVLEIPKVCSKLMMYPNRVLVESYSDCDSLVVSPDGNCTISKYLEFFLENFISLLKVV